MGVGGGGLSEEAGVVSNKWMIGKSVHWDRERLGRIRKNVGGGAGHWKSSGAACGACTGFKGRDLGMMNDE